MSAADLAARPPAIKGWCPGSLRPMQSGDGLVLRIKISGGRLDVATLRAIAELGRRCGNGLFDLSHRANLQMRGVSDATLPDVLRALDDLGLLSSDAASEQVLNVLAPPLAGVDTAALIDGRVLVAGLEQTLRSDRRLHALPGKFGFIADDGGRLSTTGLESDIALDAVRESGAVVVALRLAGAPNCAARVAPERAAEAATDLARAFLDLRAGSGARRMRALVGASGAQAIFAAAGLACAPYAPRAATGIDAVLGAHSLGAKTFLGCAAAFGRWRADQLEHVADCATAVGANDLRLTHWRAILVADAQRDCATQLADTLGRAGLIVDAADPLLAVAACPGAPDCESASVRTHQLARDLAPLFAGAPAGLRLHVSGCAKGCAHPRPAPFTLVGRGGGLDLVVAGAPDALPVATNLDPAAAHCEIARRMLKTGAS